MVARQKFLSPNVGDNHFWHRVVALVYLGAEISDLSLLKQLLLKPENRRTSRIFFCRTRKQLL